MQDEPGIKTVGDPLKDIAKLKQHTTDKDRQFAHQKERHLQRTRIKYISICKMITPDENSLIPSTFRSCLGINL